MKRLVLGMPVLFLVGFISGCSKDIKVVSDVGEISIVKQSAVATYPLDKDLARRNVQAALDAAIESNERCSRFLEKQKCQSIYIEDIYKYIVYLEKIETMPDILTVEYRTVDTNVNGDKTASGYRYVACLTSGDAYDRTNWIGIIRMTDDSGKEIETNLSDDGRVVSSIKIKVCEKYGSI